MWDKIVEIAQSGRPRIAIGLDRVNPEIEEILKQASKLADMVVMGQDVAGYQSESKATAHEAVEALKNGRIDGFVLGGFRSIDVHAEIEAQFDVRLIRIMLFRLGERYFFMGPLKVSGQESIKDRLEMTEKGIGLLCQLGQVPKVGVISIEQKYLGDDPYTDIVLTEAAYLVHHFAQEGIAIKDYTYLVNHAVLDDCTLIVTPNGLAGNWIGATLYLAGAEYMGGPGLFDHVYVHTSSSVQAPTYLSAITFATALANLRE